MNSLYRKLSERVCEKELTVTPTEYNCTLTKKYIIFMENCNCGQHNHLIPVLHDFLHFLNIFLSEQFMI